MELSPLLRRALFVAAVAVAGWLLSAAFAGTASADERPQDDSRGQHSGGLFGDLARGLTDTVGGVTGKVTDITETVIDTSGDVLTPIAHPPPAAEPVAKLPAVLPAGSSSGNATTDRDDGQSRLDLVPTPITTVPATLVVAPPPVVTPPSTTAPVLPAVTAAPAAPVAPAAQDLGDAAATEHAGDSTPEPQPVKAPASPGGSGTTASTAHDNSGSARGTHGVLPTQSELHPADAGFTSRSLATGAAGRVAGLPASSPD